MLCGCGMSAIDSSPIVDLHAVVEEYAWREFRHGNSFLSGILGRRDCFVIDIPWDFFEFDHHTTKFNPRQSSGDGFVEKNVATLCSATFTNETRVKQVYKFKSKRTTKAVTNITFQRGFTIKGAANFVVTVPKQFGDFGVSDSFEGQFKVSKCYGETFEEEFDWEIDNDIIVEKHHVTEAKMVITEDELVADFEVRTTIRMPANNAPVEIRKHKSDDTKTVILLQDLSDVFNQLKGRNINIVKVTDNRKGTRYDIEVMTVGVIRSTRWRDRRITLTSKSLRPPSVKTGASRNPLLTESFSFDSDDILTRVLRHATLAPHLPPIARKGDDHDTQTAAAVAKGRETKVLTFPSETPRLSDEAHEHDDIQETIDTTPLLETSLNNIEFPPPPQVDQRPEMDIESLPDIFADATIQENTNNTLDTISETSSLHKLFSLHAQTTVESDAGTSVASSDVTMRDVTVDVTRKSSDVPMPKGILVTSKRGAKLSKVTSV